MTVVSVLAFGVTVRHAVTANERRAARNISAPPFGPAKSDDAGSTARRDYLAATAAEAARFTAQAAKQSAQVSQKSTGVRSLNDASSTAIKPRTGEPAAAEENQTEVDQPRMPLVFLDYTGVLPDTPEVAAAVQKLRQDFVDATGAATANPADPNYAALWNQFQPTADEIFCAIFGTEACNSLSIAEARQRGHF